MRVLSKPYVVTPKRLAAFRQNLAKARAARLAMPETYSRSRYNALRHGLHAKSLEESSCFLEEDALEMEVLLRLLQDAFCPEDASERFLVRQLGEAVRRRLRLYRAQAHWEMDTLVKTLGAYRPGQKLSADETQRRALDLMTALLSDERLYHWRLEVAGGVERLLRVLMRKRAPGRPMFRILTHRTRKELDWLNEADEAA